MEDVREPRSRTRVPATAASPIFVTAPSPERGSRNRSGSKSTVASSTASTVLGSSKSAVATSNRATAFTASLAVPSSQLRSNSQGITRRPLSKASETRRRARSVGLQRSRSLPMSFVSGSTRQPFEYGPNRQSAEATEDGTGLTLRWICFDPVIYGSLEVPLNLAERNRMARQIGATIVVEKSVIHHKYSDWYWDWWPQERKLVIGSRTDEVSLGGWHPMRKFSALKRAVTPSRWQNVGDPHAWEVSSPSSRSG